MPARLFALVLATIALAALRTQYDVLPYGPGANSLGDRLWFLAGYFTILTNTGVTITMLAVAQKYRFSGSFFAGLVVSIAMVGIVYHLVLADLFHPVGLGWWANQGLHTVVPLGTVAWWLAFAPKDIGLRHIPKWLIWPLIYCVYAMIRGQMTGFWSYPFLDIKVLGAARVAVNIGGLVLAFVVLGLAIVGIARWVSRTFQPERPS